MDFPAGDSPYLFASSLSHAKASPTVSINGAIAWTTANTAIFIPIYLPYRATIRRWWWVNGSNPGSNADIGLYSRGGSLIASSGSTAQSGASAQQFVTLGTPVVVDPGTYFLAFTLSATTASRMTGVSAATVAFLRARGVQTMASALPLPATATFATPAAAMSYPLCGITSTASYP